MRDNYATLMSNLDEFKLIQDKVFIDNEEMYNVLLAIAENRVKAIIRNKDKFIGDPTQTNKNKGELTMKTTEIIMDGYYNAILKHGEKPDTAFISKYLYDLLEKEI